MMLTRTIAADRFAVLLAISTFLVVPLATRNAAADSVPASSAVAHGEAQPQVEKDSWGVTLRSGQRETRAEVWADGVIRITHRTIGSIPGQSSLVVIAQPEKTPWTLEDSGAAVILATSKVQVKIDKASGSIHFFDLNSKPILEETANGTWLSTVTTGSAKDTIEAGQKFNLPPDESIYGLGQHPSESTLDYTGSSVQLLQENTRVAVPVLLSSKGYALFWDNPAVTNVDIGKADAHAVQWLSEAGDGVDYYFFAGPRPDQAIAEYRWLTGKAPLLPLWAWGFWQSRERYKTQQEILDIAGGYRSRGIPFDGIIQDWQYWAPLNQETAEGGWGSHEFDSSRYPDPKQMVDELHKEHVHMMVVSWAKFDVTNSGVSIPNLRKLEAVDGAYNPAIPYVFPPGRGKWYDPFNDRARRIYADEIMKNLFSLGIDAWWLDASEAELSGNWGEFRKFKTAHGSGATVFNAYPLEHTRAVYEGQRAVSSDKRVVILTRASYAGQQRNSAITWSGDIHSKWEVFQQQIPAGLNFVASGVPYWNTDIGGFFGNDPDNPQFRELFTRWFQFGAFCPMFRVHGTDKPKEVWRFDPETQKTLIDVINLRYHLLPYIYSVSWRVTNNGYTMMRPLVMDFPDDLAARKIGDQFMFGPSILVNPVTHPGVNERALYLPKGTQWIDFWTGASIEGGKTIQAPAPITTMPLYVRAGSIVPYGPPVQWATEKIDAPIELRIYPGADGEFTFYEDEDDNYDYERGAFATIPLQWNDTTKTLTIGERSGSYPGMPGERIFKIVYVSQGHGTGTAVTDKVDRTLHYRGSKIDVHLD